ncbi:MAG TPA: N-acetylmuramoyl-L-alanine amidase [Acidimicrobiales bacterium]|nr:N-acetylmuramoyl-L-alanine amidase [Acidimicrobiales bacterium]
MLAIVARAQWGAAFGVSPNRVPLGQRRFFVLHWPGGGVGDERQWMRNVERQHRVNQGWSAAPGYNFCVGQSGTIYEGCGRDIRGVHSPPRNTDGFGVCVMQPINVGPSQAALNSTRALYDNLCQLAGRGLHVSWHSADVATGCPGAQLVAWARAGMPATGGPAPPPPAVPSTQLVLISGRWYPMSIFKDDADALQAAVLGWWADYLGRVPDIATLAHWVNVIRDRGFAGAFLAFLNGQEVQDRLAKRP